MDVENQKLFSSATTYALGTVGGGNTKNACTDEIIWWHYRNPEINDTLPLVQPRKYPCSISVLGGPVETWTLREAVALALDVSSSLPSLLLEKLLIDRGYTMTLKQLDKMVAATCSGEETGMVGHGYGNFTFIENRERRVSVLKACIPTHGRFWDLTMTNIDSRFRYDQNHRLLFRNLRPEILQSKISN